MQVGQSGSGRVTPHLNVVLVQSSILNLNTARRTCLSECGSNSGGDIEKPSPVFPKMSNFVRHAFNDSILISIWMNVYPQTNNRVNNRNALKTVYVFHYFTATLRVSACRT